jgi:predicted nucleic acid-binding protein
VALRKVIIDTNAYVAFKRGDAGAVEVVRLADRLGMPAVVLGELLAGFAGGAREAEKRTDLADLLASSRVSVLPIGERTAEYYARTYQQLRRRGRPIPTNDLWIAATAQEHGYSLFTFDDHFATVEGLLTGSRPEDFLP